MYLGVPSGAVQLDKLHAIMLDYTTVTDFTVNYITFVFGNVR